MLTVNIRIIVNCNCRAPLRASVALSKKKTLKNRTILNKDYINTLWDHLFSIICRKE